MVTFLKYSEQPIKLQQGRQLIFGNNRAQDKSAKAKNFVNTANPTNNEGNDYLLQSLSAAAKTFILLNWDGKIK